MIIQTKLIIQFAINQSMLVIIQLFMVIKDFIIIHMVIIIHIMGIVWHQVMVVDLLMAIMMGTVEYFNLVNIIFLFHMVIDLVS